MSDARKCDKCNQLFEPVFGCVSIDIAVKGKGKGQAYHDWSDVDFCGTCSAKLLDLIESALQGLARPRRKARGAK
jgi:hypothetical protein